MIAIPPKPKSHLVEFYGTECKFCIKVAPLLERVEEELGVTIERFEVWHNEENAKLWKQMDDGFCGGVPFMINTKTGKKICGYVDYPKLKAWAQGK